MIECRLCVLILPTASNTGNNLGACPLLQVKLEKKLLTLACRHHINEIVISDVFGKCYNLSTGPDIPLFKRFQKAWNFIDKNRFEPLNIDIPWKADVITKCKQQLGEFHPRADYKEFLELTIIFLGDIPPKGVHFRHPGALHRARWMARVIYAIKIVLFHSQFRMTKSEKEGMKRFVMFATHHYVGSWFSAPLAPSAPRTDLELLKQFERYEDEEISKAAVNALCRHLWYLSEELISLAFFDEAIPLEIKRQMVTALQNKGSEVPPKRKHRDFTLTNLQNKTLADFVTSSSRIFFERLSLPSSFLEVDPAEWSSLDDYKISSNFVKSMSVVNDTAERGVALIQNFSNHLTKNEEQLQYILQVVEKHRQTFPNANISTFKIGMSQLSPHNI